MEKAITTILNLMKDKSANLETVLYAVLSKYDMQEKGDELITTDNSWANEVYQFLARKATSGLSPNTIKLYRYNITNAFIYINKPIDQITEYDIFDYFNYMKFKRGISNSFLNSIRKNLSSFFSWQHERGVLQRNPIKAVDSIKVEKHMQNPFTDEELELIKMNCDNIRDKALIEFLYVTGVRVSELTNLNISDIDFQTLEVNIINGKGGKDRKTYLTPTASLHLKRYLSQRTDDNPALFTTIRKYKNRTTYIRLTTDAIRKRLKTLEKRSHVNDIHPHRFRHTLATNLLKKGMPVQEVQRILGHESIETTMIYCKISNDNVKHSYRNCMSA